VPESGLGRIRQILGSGPRQLPADHQQRYEMLKEELHSGSFLRIAEVLKDLAWRRDRKHHLTVRGKRLFDRAFTFLAGEVVGAQGKDVDVAEARISRTLGRSKAVASAM
jgi:RNA polymerase-interacting CarD/CdnL/TRCF family regulator